MTELDELLEQLPDGLRKRKLEEFLSELRRGKRFGLQFENHAPECVTLYGVPPSVGDLVQFRNPSVSDGLWKVVSGSTKKLKLEKSDDETQKTTASATDLVVVKKFGEPVYPTLTSVGKVERAKGKPFHSVINGENFHALQLLLFQFQGQVDCIYIDPPYNTGARDWKYNNRYVDSKDTWRHSKWLSFMEKRLHLARKLLKPDGVLIVTIDDYEVHHLGMLLEKVMPEYLRYMITIIINPKGRDSYNFAPVGEYAFFMVPDTGTDVIEREPIPKASRSQTNFDFNTETKSEDTETQDEETEEDDIWEYRHARRRGGGAEMSSYREKRWNQFYPIFIDETKKVVVKAGKSIPLGVKPDFKKVNGLRPIWPIDKAGEHRVWAFNQESMQKRIDEGNVILGKYHSSRDEWTINYRIPKKNTRKLKSVWWKPEYDAGTHGTELIKKLLGKPGLFPFPKSVNAVKDTIAAVVRNRPNALILDFFAGSGTTLHSTCLLNSEDGGQRRCILVTNNEVAEKTASDLIKKGHLPGDNAYEMNGIFELVTRPRCEAVISGKTPDGEEVPGSHSNGRPLALGFEENVEFFKLEYLNTNEVGLGRAFKAILPTIWMASGGVGKRELPAKEAGFSIPEKSTYAVLFSESHFKSFVEALKKRPDVSHLWLITDSEEAYAEMRANLNKQGFLKRCHVKMLYRDYLVNFEINTDRNL